MRKYVVDDYIGYRFGMIEIVGESPSFKGRSMAIVKCDCGNIAIHPFKVIKSGRIKSCGCNFGSGNTIHGLSGHPLYSVWANIKDRCTNSKARNFYLYGGIGIIMCQEWINGFIYFYNWAIDKWQPGLQIDKDILYKKKHGTNIGMIYSPEYCCFVTSKENCNNKGNNKLLRINGVSMTVTQATEIYNIPESTLGNRLKRGWDDTKAATTPRMTQYASH